MVYDFNHGVKKRFLHTLLTAKVPMCLWKHNLESGHRCFEDNKHNNFGCCKMQFSSSKYTKMRLRPGLHPGPHWGSLQCSQTPSCWWSSLSHPKTQHPLSARQDLSCLKEVVPYHLNFDPPGCKYPVNKFNVCVNPITPTLTLPQLQMKRYLRTDE